METLIKKLTVRQNAFRPFITRTSRLFMKLHYLFYRLYNDRRFKYFNKCVFFFGFFILSKKICYVCNISSLLAFYYHFIQKYKRKFTLALKGVLAYLSVHVSHSTQPPFNIRRNLLTHGNIQSTCCFLKKKTKRVLLKPLLS